MRKEIKGFTLVELAIVLVIIGLLVGGVLQGQELIAQARIRNVISTINQLDASVATFRAKYNNALPGDYNAAVAAGICTNCVTSTGGGGGNGDGDGILEQASGSNATDQFSGEIANVWPMLTNVGLVKGSYSATPSSGTVAVGTGYPALPIGNGVVMLTDRAVQNRLNYVVGVAATINTASAMSSNIAGASMTPEQAWAIDVKQDDGLTTSGSVQDVGGYDNAGTFSNSSSGTAGCRNATAYNLSLTTSLCTIRIRASS